MNISVESAMLLPLFIATGAFLGGQAYEAARWARRTGRRG